MRIAYLVSRYPFVSHVFILREVLALRRAGAEIDTFTVRRAGPDHILSDDDREAEATTHALVPPNPIELLGAHLSALVTRPHRYLSTLRLAMALRGRGARATLWQLFYFGESALMWRECGRRGIRHIHAHHANVASDVALLAAHLGGPDWSWSFTMHGSTEFFDVREHRLPRKVELAEFVVCVSDHGRSQLMNLVEPPHWDKLVVVHCGVDTTVFDRRDGRPRSGPVRLLTVGRVVPVKGYSLLVEAVAELERRGIQVELVVVGDGDQLPSLRALAVTLGVAERITFAGAVGQDEIRPYFERADVFVMTSFAEGLPVVLIEAMSMGLPVVAPCITGIPELVEDGVSGILFTPGRGDQLADGLERVALADPESRAAMGRAGRSMVVEQFDVDKNAERMLDVFGHFLPREARAGDRLRVPVG